MEKEDSVKQLENTGVIFSSDDWTSLTMCESIFSQTIGMD